MIPSWGDPRHRRMIENRPYWLSLAPADVGRPIPRSSTKRAEHCTPYSRAHEAWRARGSGRIDAWFDLDAAELLCAEAATSQTTTLWTLCGWLGSALMRRQGAPEMTRARRAVSRGLHQHRGWFPVPCDVAGGLYERAPYKAWLTHGFTVYARVGKMSSRSAMSPPDK